MVNRSTNLPELETGLSRRTRRLAAMTARGALAIPTAALAPAMVVSPAGNGRLQGDQYWRAKGFHHVAAYTAAGIIEVPCVVHQGGLRDAILHSVGANATHGLRRSNADKRRAVAILLDDPEWATWSNSEIARRCAVDEGLVRKMKAKRPSSDDPKMDAPRTVSRGGKVYSMDTVRIGRQSADPNPGQATAPT